MTGAEIVGALLRQDAAVTAMVPIAQIKGGRLGADAPLPVLLVRTVSLVDRQPLKRQAWCRSVERVAVAVRAANYRDQGQIIRLVRSCCAHWTGNLLEAERIAIRTDGLGPDVDGPGNTFEQTQDFRVSYDHPWEQ